ncbi:hypothetical protein NQ314_016493 [Rhamnusium bicolor]|uniref:PiggyBac transposable element-derived protein domain-containing protein n=1 Tax=Rhamnusium bicolor TaxID=1586634 RepID=A0AAV8WW56_9CUCU|nr:hypothetical protein NQ314_016493 [Rhamnusium bicolor]
MTAIFQEKRKQYEKTVAIPTTRSEARSHGQISKETLTSMKPSNNQISEETPTPSTSIITSTITNPFSAVARTLDRYGISDRAGAAIISATLQDIGIIIDNDMSNVVDRSKVRRCRTKTRTILNKNPFNFEGCIGISFDGRKDKTLVTEDNRRKVINEEHISLLKEPGSEYIRHISITSNNNGIELIEEPMKMLNTNVAELTMFIDEEINAAQDTILTNLTPLTHYNVDNVNSNGSNKEVIENESSKTSHLVSDDEILSNASLQDPYSTDEDSEYDPAKDPSVKESSSDEDTENFAEDNVEIDIAGAAINEDNTTEPSQIRKQTRKRKRNEADWRRNCAYKCNTKINEERRNILFKEYWNLADVNRQRSFIANLIDIKRTARNRVRNKKILSEMDSEETTANSRRQFTNVYHFFGNTTDFSKIQACQTFFLNTLRISAQVVKTVVKKLKGNCAIPETDLRGKVRCNSRLPECIKQSVRDHINMFEPIKSHYCRKQTKRTFLPSELSITKIHNLHQIYCRENNIIPAKPKKDQCGLCTQYSNSSVIEKAEMQAEYDFHTESKILSRDQKNKDKEKAGENASYCAAVFDFDGLTLKEALDIAYDEGDVSEISIEPPTDENSGDEDVGSVADNLNPRQLRAGAEIVFANSERLGDFQSDLTQTFDTDVDHNIIISNQDGPPSENRDTAIEPITVSVPELSTFIDGGLIGVAQDFPLGDYMKYSTMMTYVEIFESFFTPDLFDKIISETRNYALFKNKQDPNLSIPELKLFIAILVLSGYNQLPSKRSYWEASSDMKNIMVSEAMIMDRFLQICHCIHFADNNNIDRNDKISNPEYETTFGKAAAPMVQMIEELKEKRSLRYNFFFDNLFISKNLLSTIKINGYGGTGAIRDNRIPKNCPLVAKKAMENRFRGEYSSTLNKESGILYVRWKDNNIVTVASTCFGVQPLKPVESYRIGIRSKKWYWPIFTYLIDAAIQNAWILYRKSGKNISQLEFRRNICQLEEAESHQEQLEVISVFPIPLDLTVSITGLYLYQKEKGEDVLNQIAILRAVQCVVNIT